MWEFTEEKYVYGERFERAILPVLRNRLDRHLNLTDRYHPFDFESDKYLIELKSMRCNSTHYDFALVPASKIERADRNKKIYIIWRYTDDICLYIKYNQKKFKDFQIKKLREPTVFIPFQELKGLRNRDKKRWNRYLETREG